MKRKWNGMILSVLLFAVLPLQARAAQLLIPVGEVIGLQLQNGTVTVAAYDDLLGGQAKKCGLKIGDEIVKAGETEVTSAADVRRALEQGEAELTVRRDGKLSTLSVSPVQTEDGPRLGVYLRQGIAGIGTVTFYDPDSGSFGALGHGVSNGKGALLELTRGNVYEAGIQSIKKGKCGEPGQLRGTAEGTAVLGELLRNTPQGVFGKTQRGWKGDALPTAAFDEVKTGPAVIRSTVSDGGAQEYSVEIMKIYPKERADGRNFLLRVTDPELLAATGGIVQGMSGSPICQNGKIVGAVTHVLVNDPTMGYGIYIGNMLDAAA